MGILQFSTASGKAVSSASDTLLAGVTDGYALKARFDGGMIAAMGSWEIVDLVQIDDTAGTNLKLRLRLEANGSGGVTASLVTGAVTLMVSPVVARSLFAAGTYVVLYIHHFQTLPASGNRGIAGFYTDAGSLIGTLGTQTFSNGALANTAGGTLRMPVATAGSYFGNARRVDGLAIYSAELTGTARSSAPAASDANLVGLWLCDETSGATVANSKTGGQPLTLQGVETTDYAWLAGGTWGGGATPPTADFTTSINQKTVTVTDASVAGTNPITSWTWSWGDGTPDSTGQVPGPHTYAADGTYTITLTVSDGSLSDPQASAIKTKVRRTWTVKTVGGRSASTTLDVNYDYSL